MIDLPTIPKFITFVLLTTDFKLSLNKSLQEEVVFMLFTA